MYFSDVMLCICRLNLCSTENNPFYIVFKQQMKYADV